MKQIILASGSSRRKEILDKLNIPFIVDPSNFEEDMSQDMGPEELAKSLSSGKAKEVSVRHKNSIVIGADTFIYFEGKKLGKPKGPRQAEEMLSSMSGKMHSVFTGLTLIDTDTNEVYSEAVETKVYFRNLDPDEIRAYVASEEPLDKAGAYALQGIGSILVEKIEGDFFNVMGLPLTALYLALRNIGISPFSK